MNLPNMHATLAIPREKQVRIVAMSLGGIVVLFIGILGFRLLSGSFVRAEDIAPKNVAIIDIAQNSARIKWTTERETQSVIEYGSTPTSLTFFAPEAVKAKDHSIELNLLTGGTSYYFQIQTGDKKFDNGGVPWTFTTLTQEEAASSPTPTAPLSEDAEEITGQPTLEPTLPFATSTPTSSVIAKDTKCSLTEYKNYFNTSNTKYDQDNNRVVNFRDWSLCNATYGTLAPSSTPTPTSSSSSSSSSTTPTITPNPS